MQAPRGLQEHLGTGKPSQAQEPNVLKPTLDYHLRNPWGSLAQAPEPGEKPFLVSSLRGLLFSCPKAILFIALCQPLPDLFPVCLSPAARGQHNDRGSTALEGSLHGPDSRDLSGITAQWRCPS